MTLTAMLVCAAMGTVLDMTYDVGGLLTFIASLAFMCWLAMTPHTPGNDWKRNGILMTFAFLNGCSIGPVVEHAYHIDPSCVPCSCRCRVFLFVVGSDVSRG